MIAAIPISGQCSFRPRSGITPTAAFGRGVIAHPCDVSRLVTTHHCCRSTACSSWTGIIVERRSNAVGGLITLMRSSCLISLCRLKLFIGLSLGFIRILKTCMLVRLPSTRVWRIHQVNRGFIPRRSLVSREACQIYQSPVATS